MKKLSVKSIRRILMLLALLLSGVFITKANKTSTTNAEKPPLEGRWDMTIHTPNGDLPSWLEVKHSGNTRLVGQFVGSGGSARPISKINFVDGKMSFSIPPQWEKEDNDIVVEATLQGDSLTGTITTAKLEKYTWVAYRAPKLWREKEPVWGNPIQLFNGKDLSGWHPSGEINQWVVESGVLKSPKKGSNIITDKTFTDFKLHIEFRYPTESNSGVYLRGRYEIQIEDSKGKEPTVDYLGAIYGFLPPTEQMAKDAGEWQSYDVTLVGRMVTLAVNGKTVICNREIPGITGGAINSKEGEPGPILLQGDHTAIEFRNIVITPAK
jgi:hypothetical protein